MSALCKTGSLAFSEMVLGSVRPVGVGIDKTVSAEYSYHSEIPLYEFRYFKCTAIVLYKF